MLHAEVTRARNAFTEPRRSAPSSNTITIENLDQSVEKAIQKTLRAPPTSQSKRLSKVRPLGEARRAFWIAFSTDWSRFSIVMMLLLGAERRGSGGTTWASIAARGVPGPPGPHNPPPMAVPSRLHREH
ncbi:hypothetical protein E4U09_007234 [Claviceps aff. purpurea]|uniref:Uncharacterized protein n=1 Tax=Claviceps aff. purpurea TaxID=1967640 RepID=A0A9P7TY89_9HYPO|nr:hypothetical protein E4U09_007234 [Claviceps aff. purpurea]